MKSAPFRAWPFSGIHLAALPTWPAQVISQVHGLDCELSDYRVCGVARTESSVIAGSRVVIHIECYLVIMILIPSQMHNVTQKRSTVPMYPDMTAVTLLERLNMLPFANATKSPVPPSVARIPKRSSSSFDANA